MQHTTYILVSLKNGHYYIGSCESIDRRIKQHNSGKTRSTKGGAPWRVVYLEHFDSRQQAYARERQIKSYKGGEAFKKLINV